MDLKSIYEKSYDFLVNESKGYVSKEQIDSFISMPDVSECRDLHSAYILLLSILQDFNMYPNVIQFEKRKEQMLRILHDGDLKYISALDEAALLTEFKNEFAFQNDTLWRKYCKSIITGARFMSCFIDDDDFNRTFDSFNKNDMTREAFALFLSKKIYNMGFAIACTWLKELGYYKYAKPDTHIKDVCLALNLIPNNDEILCFEAITKVANAAGVEAYQVDKVWWLICSGNFYRYQIVLPHPKQRKEQFLMLCANNTASE